MKRAALALVAVLGLAVVVLATGIVAPLVWPTSSAERSARVDVDAISSAVADYVASTGRLPRLAVSPGVSGSGDSIWGADFLVESRAVPRGDPADARIFFLVGDSDHWCVEALYTPPTLFSDSSGEWVMAKGEAGNVGRVVDGRCGGDYVLELSPETRMDGVPQSGMVVATVSAPAGTCYADPYSPDSVAQPGWIEVVDCNSAHYGEVFFAGEGSGSGFGAYEEAAAGSCAAELASFTGVPRLLSAFTAEPVTVDQAAWDEGARHYTCILFLSLPDYPLVGSARGSWR